MLKKRENVLLSLAKLFLITLCLTNCSISHRARSTKINNHKAGALIVFVGISGSGKSTLARELAHLVNAKLFLEPEEAKWPEVVTQNTFYGNFSAMTALRNIRIKNLFDAAKFRDEGHNVLVDSYYDKITSYYINKKGMEWLISPEDPYMKAAVAMTRSDTKYLPDADYMILLDPDIDTWKSFLKNRNRAKDLTPGFQENVSLYKSYIENAVHKLSEQMGIKLIKFKMINVDGKSQALRLKETLIHERIIDS